MVPVRVKAKPDATTHGSVEIEFRIEGQRRGEADLAPVVIVEKTRFIVP